MNNLHRQLAPISEAAWGEIDQEARRTFIRWIAGRRVVDVVGPDGEELAAVRTGHQVRVDTPFEGVQAHQRQVRQIVELRVPFRVSREADDAVEPRGRASKGYSGGEIASLPSLSPNERMSPWLANRVAHILAEEYTQGTSIQELANRSGYSIARVRSLLKKSGVPFRDRGRRRTATPA